MPKKLDPTHVFHWGTSVPDMDKAVKAWTASGAQVVMPPVIAEGVGVECCVIALHDAVFELVAPTNDAMREMMKPRFETPGIIDHVAYFTDDMTADMAMLEKDGGEVKLPVTFNTGFDRNMAFLQMPTGLVVELMDRKAAGKKPQDPLTEFFKRT